MNLIGYDGFEATRSQGCLGPVSMGGGGGGGMAV